jgi:hypothetical protein
MTSASSTPRIPASRLWLSRTLARRLLSIATMLAGALSGAALTLYTSPVAALALALSLLGVVAAAAVAAASHPAPWRTPPAQPR